MSPTQKRPRRELTEGESFVLQQIQDLYGNQNTEQDVFFSKRDEAFILVRDQTGVEGLFAVLTNLATMYADGDFATIKELRTHLLEAAGDG